MHAYRITGVLHLTDHKFGVFLNLVPQSRPRYLSQWFTELWRHNGMQAVNPYGRSKLIIEDMFRDLFAAEPDWQIILLRYFNPVGSHVSGTLILLKVCVAACYQVLLWLRLHVTSASCECRKINNGLHLFLQRRHRDVNCHQIAEDAQLCRSDVGHIAYVLNKQ